MHKLGSLIGSGAGGMRRGSRRDKEHRQAGLKADLWQGGRGIQSGPGDLD